MPYRVHSGLQADSFQSDIFPPAPSSEPSLTAGEFFSGKNPSLKLVNLDSGEVSTAAASMASLPTPAPIKTASAPAPEPAAVPQPAPRKTEQEPTPVTSSAPTPATPIVASPAEYRSVPPEQIGSGNASEIKALKEENAALQSELREAREKIRNLELQVEGIRANARKAAEALLQG
jgi:coronin-1B/1C/6